MVGCGINLIWNRCFCKPPKRDVFREGSAQLLGESEEAEPIGTNFNVGACIAVAFWLSTLILAAGKMDGWTVPASLVFTPFLIVVSIMLCCCTCLACCGPTLVDAAIQNESELRQPESSQGRNNVEMQNVHQD